MRLSMRPSCKIVCAVAVACAVIGTPGRAQTAAPLPASEIDADIAAMRQFHRAAKEAGERLVLRGEDILDRLHAAMLAPDANDKQRIQLAIVLAEIASPSSIGPLIELAQAHPQQAGIRQDVLNALAELPETEAARQFVESVLENRNESYRVRRKALVYFGRHRDARARRWVDAYVADPELELRVSALYLAARLGDATAREPIVEALNLPAPPNTRYALLLGLAELAGPAEVEALSPDWIRPSWEYKSALRLSTFRTTDPASRLRLTDEMIESESHVERQVAAEYILEERGPDGLTDLLTKAAPQRSAARNQLRRAGYRVFLAPDGKPRVQRRDPR